MKHVTLCFLLMMGCVGKGVAAKMNDRMLYGYVEKVTLVGKNVTVSAKLDTGAKSASLSAVQIKRETEQGKTFLSFYIPTKMGHVPFRAELVGRVKIKPRVDEPHTTKKPLPHAIYRPMVKVRLKLGEKIQEISVNLTNRKRFLYPLLLGRDAIVAFHGVVDPSRAFLVNKQS